MRRFGLAAALAACLVSGGLVPWDRAADAAELVMFETSGCPWCAKWHREVGGLYSKTEEGQALPLRTAALGAVPRDLKSVRGIKYAPTFVVMDCGKEQGRIVGYQGDGLFWGELSTIFTKMKAEGRPKARC